MAVPAAREGVRAAGAGVNTGRVIHEVASAVLDPQPNKVYGAKMETIHLRRGKPVVRWRIFARKPRKSKKTPAAK